MKSQTIVSPSPLLSVPNISLNNSLSQETETYVVLTVVNSHRPSPLLSKQKTTM